jgi:aromatic-L-amino-acid decarboxylase
VDASPDFERLAPTPFSVVCFHATPCGRAWTEDELARLNEAIMKRVNDSGEIFLSHTVLNGRFTLRVAIGNLQTTDRHVARAWELIQQALATEIRQLL